MTTLPFVSWGPFIHDMTEANLSSSIKVVWDILKGTFRPFKRQGSMYSSERARARGEQRRRAGMILLEQGGNVQLS